MFHWKTIYALLCALSALAAAADPNDAATATNQFALDLYRQLAGGKPRANLLLSPYSIETALAMTCAGADGETRAELARALHFPKVQAPMHASFRALRETLASVGNGVELRVANRLFGQEGYAFDAGMLSFMHDTYAAELEPLSFRTGLDASRTRINGWVEAQTANRIRNILAPGSLDERTRLVLVNALYFKAKWADQFAKAATADLPFAVPGARDVKVRTMTRRQHYGYVHRDGFTAVSVPYTGGQLHLLVLLPDAADGLAALTPKVTPELLKEYAALGTSDVVLYLPKLKLEPETIQLVPALRALGVKTAFDPNAADFTRLAPPTTEGPLAISTVLHKTFLALDEEETEAAAATVVGIPAPTAMVHREKPKEPIVVRVDHPFLFAVQHRASGACLFLGRVVDPR